MSSICRIDVSKTHNLLSPIKITHGQSDYPLDLALFDSGAAICHMTYGLWRWMKLHEACWNGNPSLCKLMGFASANDMIFDTLPLNTTYSILGDGSPVKVYEFRLDKLELGKPTLGFNHSIILDNITVRLINRKDLDFIVGWNVLKYLTPTYHPSTTSLLYQLELEEAGHQLFLQDRARKVSNHMQSMFNYR